MPNYRIISYKTKKEVNEKDSVTTDDLGGPLEVVYDYKRLKTRLNSYVFETTPISSLKYLDLYPINDLNNVVSLDEGGTPLYKSSNLYKDLKIKNLYFKYEGANPTGSFKDRGTVIEVAKAIELGAKAITLASTGNMAASVAAYAKKANIPCYVFVPEGTPTSKLAQSLAFGANVIQVRGAYVDAAKLAEKVAKKYKFYLAGDYCFRQEGQKSIAYEIVEQLRWHVPDYVVVPVGVGTNISAIYKGFKEYKELGLIDKLPKIIAVQAEGASPIIKTFNLNLKEFYIESKVNTLSGAIAVGNPLDGVKVIDLLKESKGFAVAVNDNETLEAQLELSNKESIFVEPSSATVIAALKSLVAENKIPKNSTVVCVLTGNGLKDPERAVKLLAAPPTIDLTIEAFDHFMEFGHTNRNIKMTDTELVLFESIPTIENLKRILQKKQTQI